LEDWWVMEFALAAVSSFGTDDDSSQGPPAEECYASAAIPRIWI